MSAPAAISPPSQASVLYIPLLVRDDYGGTGYQWLDAVTGGQVVAQGDETHQSVDLPFPFTFYGNTYTTLWVSSNGFVNFGAGHSFYANSCLPSLATPNNAIYAFWDDLAPTGGSNGNIYFKTLDVNTFVVEWYQVKRYDSDDHETFEIVLRRDGSIKLQYQS
ncbi:MAG: hypothetical protein ACRDH2_08265, partial [Anaerolineales bacterium]